MFLELPDFYPDECVVSMLSRLKYRLMFLDATRIYNEVFGEQVVIRHDLPANLEALTRALPKSSMYDIDYVINKHTLFPYYRPFISAERQQSCHKAMSGRSSRDPMLIVGLANGSLPIIQRFRFCPECFVEDYERYGECYWHRLHQVAGVEVCPIHRLFLEQSNAPAHRPLYSQRLVAADEVAVDFQSCGRPIAESNSDDMVLLKLAQDVSWLLEQTEVVADPESIASRYSSLFAERGLTFPKGHVRLEKVFTAMTQYCSSEVLAQLECQLEGKLHGNWLNLILRGAPYARNPICYLLIMQFLGYTAESFFRLSIEHTQVDECTEFATVLDEESEPSTWPCLNPVCIHYRQNVIKYDAVEVAVLPNGHRQVTVPCECGFTYTRLSLGTTQNSLPQIRRVIQYGQLWDDAFAQRWCNRALTQAQVAQQLGFRSRDSLYMHARRLGLPTSRFAPIAYDSQQPAPPKPRGRPRSADSPDAIKRLRSEKRRMWLKILRDNPGINRTRAQKYAPSEYWWLNKYDQEWLRANLPAKVKLTHPKRQVDASARDVELSALVRKAAAEIRTLPGIPVKITRTSISRHLGNYIFAHPVSLAKLPLTQQALVDVTESHEDFTVRRIWWVAGLYRNEGEQPTLEELSHRASVEGRAFRDSVRVQQALDDAIESFY